MAKEGSTPKMKEQQQVAASGTSARAETTASKQVSTTASQLKMNPHSDDQRTETQNDRAAKRAKVKEEAATADIIDIDPESPEPAILSVSGHQQGVHGPHGPVTTIWGTPGSNGGQTSQTGQNMPTTTTVHQWAYLNGDDFEYGPIEFVVSVEEAAYKSMACRGTLQRAQSDQTLTTIPLCPHCSQPLPEGMVAPITPNEARTRLDELHYMLVRTASIKDKAQAEGVTFRQASPQVGWIESMLNHAAVTLQRFGGGAATTHLYRHVEAEAQRVREVLLQLREVDIPAAGQGGETGGGNNESSGGQAAGSGDGDGVAGGGQE